MVFSRLLPEKETVSRSEHPENAEALLSSIIKLERNFICRISHVEPGMEAKQYFKDLIEKFNAQVIEMVDQINNG